MKKEVEVGLLARINLAVLSYYRKAEEFMTEENYIDWLKSLTHESLVKHFAELGFEQGKNSIPFMRYVLELNDVGMEEHLKANLSNEDYAAWLNPNSSLMIPKEMNILKSTDHSKLL